MEELQVSLCNSDGPADWRRPQFSYACWLLGSCGKVSLHLQEEKPPLAKEKSSRFANFFQSETSAPGMAMGPAAAAGNAAPVKSAAGQPPFQNPFPAQLGGQALLQQLQAAQQQQVCGL